MVCCIKYRVSLSEVLELLLHPSTLPPKPSSNTTISTSLCHSGRLRPDPNPTSFCVKDGWMTETAAVS
jgi:hypothetical protein